MFSNRSVSVQPSAPPIEYAGVPDALSVFASLTRSSKVFGAVTPASLNDLTLYQMVDLLAPLKMRPYSFPLIVPSLTMSVGKLLEMVPRANSNGFSAPRPAKSFTSPGCETDARSGGLPPWTAVESTVGVLSPLGLYLTVTFGYLALKPFRTAWNDFCSSPVQTPVMVTLPETLLLAVVPPPPELFFELPPHPAATSASGSASSRRAMTVWRGFMPRLLCCLGRSRDPYPGRRNEGCGG